MFLGEFQHALDAKGRVILPAKFRDQLESGGFVTSEVDGCLAVWTPEEFEVKAADIKERSRTGSAGRDQLRAFFSGAVEAAPDRQGRIAIPQALRDFASLERDVVVAGMFDHLEIWDAEAWRAKKRAGEAGLAGGA
jgi:MraZ protein